MDEDVSDDALFEVHQRIVGLEFCFAELVRLLHETGVIDGAVLSEQIGLMFDDFQRKNEDGSLLTEIHRCRDLVDMATAPEWNGPTSMPFSTRPRRGSRRDDQ
ncbi:hypothetical protein [Microbaculum marinisediminis]|uniref:Uncharacterized protein n=1 Tax=Microbaculum marinisediminis TaxID=2931392 RepID=A0AAW5QRC5_9HYPH|nr:hypothetical protein [Microbaculum sp. A6E488]MCT8970616.1 hypothetical protein [Microbaculum sp. A6E488]